MKGQSVKGPRASRAKPSAETLAKPLEAREYVPPRGMSLAMERVRELTAPPSLIGREDRKK